jgi:hypothetical protein
MKMNKNIELASESNLEKVLVNLVNETIEQCATLVADIATIELDAIENETDKDLKEYYNIRAMAFLYAAKVVRGIKSEFQILRDKV